MGGLINGRTPEEIKQALEWMANGCPTPDMDCEECRHNKICKEITSVYTPGDALELIERLESERDAALTKVPKWIGVEERLPEHEHEVLVYTDRYGGRIEFAYYVRHLDAWYQNCCLLIPNVTHWMPIPEQPEEQK